MSFIPSISNCSLLPLLVLLSPWSFATFAAEAAEAIAKQSPYKIVSSLLQKWIDCFKTSLFRMGNDSTKLFADTSSPPLFLLNFNLDFRWRFYWIASSYF